MKKRKVTAIALTFLLVLVCANASAVSKNGSRGEEVRQIQTKLKNWGYYSGSVDGVYGWQTENAVKAGSAMLVIVAEDASENTKKLFYDKCSFYGVRVFSYGTKEELGKAIGRQQRSSLAVTDDGLAQAIEKAMKS